MNFLLRAGYHLNIDPQFVLPFFQLMMAGAGSGGGERARSQFADAGARAAETVLRDFDSGQESLPDRLPAGRRIHAAAVRMGELIDKLPIPDGVDQMKLIAEPVHPGRMGREVKENVCCRNRNR